MFKFLSRVFLNKELRTRILITIGILIVARFLAIIPMPGISRVDFANYLSQANFSSSTNGLLGIIGLISGNGMGAFSSFSIIMMGVGPYITASIIVQLMSSVIPYLEEMTYEGEAGRTKINFITKVLSIPLTFLQGYSFILFMRSQSSGSSEISMKIFQNLVGFDLFLALVAVTVGTLFLTWLGDLITEYGIGNGVSIIIFAGIVSRIPFFVSSFVEDFKTGLENLPQTILFLLLGVIVLLVVIFITEAERKVQVAYAKRMQGNRMYGGMNTYLPIKVNQGGVIPIIFAISILNFPNILAGFFQNAKTDWLATFSQKILTDFNQNSNVYLLIYFALVILFSYFYGVIALQPDKLSDNLQKQGGYIPGIRPGKPTAEFLTKVLARVTLAGSLFLGLMATMPALLMRWTGNSTMAIGGTSLLIAVSVAIEIYRFFNAQLVQYSYQNSKF
ncbi:MAG: preprotein translocase subunit SecY [Patescibacteria group bacterium]